MRNSTITRDEALDVITEHYMMGNLPVNPASDAPLAELESALSFWNVTVVENEA